jgi:hypothetical protein
MNTTLGLPIEHIRALAELCWTLQRWLAESAEHLLARAGLPKRTGYDRFVWR